MITGQRYHVWQEREDTWVCVIESREYTNFIAVTGIGQSKDEATKEAEKDYAYYENMIYPKC